MLVIGEIRTGLLQNAGEIPDPDYQRVLHVRHGERVLLSRRPIVYGVAPYQLIGVDCRLPSATGSRPRGIGTVMARTSLTSGRVLQGSSHVRIVRGEAGYRLPWSHYLARPGMIETLGKFKPADVADGFLSSAGIGGQLDLGSVSEHMMDLAQDCDALDRRAPFRSERTRLRWAATPGDPDIHFTLGVGGERTVRVSHPGDFSAAIVALCEDLALHDWLLTTLLSLVGRARIGVAPRTEVLARLAPAADALLHLWMPAARTERCLQPLWESLERTPGFTRQWTSLAQRVRDQIALGVLPLLSEANG